MSKEDRLKYKIGGFREKNRTNKEEPKTSDSFEESKGETQKKTNYKERKKELYESKLTAEEVRSRIDALNKKVTNLVFTFGDVGSSKTTVLAALNIYLRKHYLIVENTDNTSSNGHVHRIRSFIQKGDFPPVTAVNKLYEYDIACRESREEDWLNLTFVEMSGEHQRAVSYDYGGKLPQEVEIYIKENELPLIVFLVIGYDELMRIGKYKDRDINDQDSLVSTFINYLVANSIECENIGIIISKYDRNKEGTDRLDSVMPKLSATFKQIENISDDFKVFPFSVGEVEDGGKDGIDKITKLDLSDCGPIIEWIIDNFQPREPVRRNFWKFW